MLCIFYLKERGPPTLKERLEALLSKKPAIETLSCGVDGLCYIKADVFTYPGERGDRLEKRIFKMARRVMEAGGDTVLPCTLFSDYEMLKWAGLKVYRQDNYLIDGIISVFSRKITSQKKRVSRVAVIDRDLEYMDESRLYALCSSAGSILLITDRLERAKGLSSVLMDKYGLCLIVSDEIVSTPPHYCLILSPADESLLSLLSPETVVAVAGHGEGTGIFPPPYDDLSYDAPREILSALPSGVARSAFLGALIEKCGVEEMENILPSGLCHFE